MSGHFIDTSWVWRGNRDSPEVPNQRRRQSDKDKARARAANRAARKQRRRNRA